MRDKIIILTILAIMINYALAKEVDLYKPDAKSMENAANLVNKINANQDNKDVEEIIEKAEKIKEKNQFEKDVNKISDNAAEAVKSREYKQHENWIKSNKEKIFARQHEVIAKTKYNDRAQNKNAIDQLLQNYHFKQEDVKRTQIIYYPLMIFVSSSISQQSLKDLMIQARKSDAVLVFRGFVGSFKNSSEFLQRISKENAGAIIDPRLFDIFKIEMVPTFVLLKNNAQECDGAGCAATPIHDKVIGNVSLNYALELMSSKGDVKDLAKKYLEKLEGGKL